MPTNDLQVSQFVDLWPRSVYNSVMKNVMMKVRVTDLEKKAFDEAAEISGIPLSAWVRERLRKAATRELEEASRDIPFLRKAEIE